MRRRVLAGAAVVVCLLALAGWVLVRDDGVDRERVERIERQLQQTLGKCAGRERVRCRPADDGDVRCSGPGLGKDVLLDGEHPEISVIC